MNWPTFQTGLSFCVNWLFVMKNVGFELHLTWGETPSILRDGGTLRDRGILTWPKSTAKASHQTPKWPSWWIVRSAGKVSTIVLWSYLRSGCILPFSSGTRIPCDDGDEPAPTQNFASDTTKIKMLNILVLKTNGYVNFIFYRQTRNMTLKFHRLRHKITTWVNATFICST